VLRTNAAVAVAPYDRAAMWGGITRVQGFCLRALDRRSAGEAKGCEEVTRTGGHKNGDFFEPSLP